jgi:hypothetical protein
MRHSDETRRPNYEPDHTPGAGSLILGLICLVPILMLEVFTIGTSGGLTRTGLQTAGAGLVWTAFFLLGPLLGLFALVGLVLGVVCMRRARNASAVPWLGGAHSFAASVWGRSLSDSG